MTARSADSGVMGVAWVVHNSLWNVLFASNNCTQELVTSWAQRKRLPVGATNNNQSTQCKVCTLDNGTTFEYLYFNFDPYMTSHT